MIVAVAAAVLTALLAVPAFIFRQEYPDVGARLARALVAMAVRALPSGTQRERFDEEWRAEIAAIANRGTSATGLLYGASLATRYCVRRTVAAADPLSGSVMVVMVTSMRGSATLAFVSFVGHTILMSIGPTRFRHSSTSVTGRRKLYWCAAMAFTALWLARTVVVALAEGNRGPLAAVGLLIVVFVLMVATEDWRRQVLYGDDEAVSAS